MLTVWLIPRWPLALWNSTIMRDVNFLGTTMLGSIVYLCLTTFLRILLLSSRKLGSGFFISLALLLQNQSHYCSFLSTSKFRFPMLYIGVLDTTSVEWIYDIFYDVFNCDWHIIFVIILIQT